MQLINVLPCSWKRKSYKTEEILLIFVFMTVTLVKTVKYMQLTNKIARNYI